MNTIEEKLGYVYEAKRHGFYCYIFAPNAKKAKSIAIEMNDWKNCTISRRGKSKITRKVAEKFCINI